MKPFEIVPLPASVAERVRRSRRDDHGNTQLETTIASTNPGYPCRVCLRDAEIGESLLLFSYSAFKRPHPSWSVGPVFIHANDCAPSSDRREVPLQLRIRLLALRSYDDADQMVGCDLVEGAQLEELVERLFEDPLAQYIHVHNARAGCFACRIDRG